MYVDEIRLEHISEFKYLGCVLDESGTDGAGKLLVHVLMYGSDNVMEGEI